MIKVYFTKIYIDHLNSYNAAQNYESIYLLNSEGLTLASTDPTFEGNNYGFRDYFTRARSEKVYITTALGITSNNMGYYFSYPIYSRQNTGEFLGVAVIKIGEENIQKLFFSQQGWDIYLIDSSSVVIFGTNQGLILKSLVEVPELRELIGKKESQYLGKEIVSLDRELEWDKIKVSEEVLSFEAPDLQNFGKDSFFIAKRIDQINFHLLITFTPEVVLSQTQQFAQTSAGQVLVAALIALIIIGLFVYWFLFPIKEITASIDFIASGNYQNYVQVDTKDEFETMANSINNLQQKIKRDLSEIAKSVDDNQQVAQKKVKELEDLNNIMVNRELELVKLKKMINEKQKDEKVG